MTERKRAPAGLKRTGRALWTSITGPYELDPAELATLEQAARLADLADELQAVIDAEGTVAPGSRGQPRMHPGLSELRATRVAVGSLVARLKLPSGEARSASATSTKARAAARARWNARKVGA